ncbi:COG1470 family protein [Paenibacillus senegalensis]|uniref:COG1470 family protein n=1 Tax=Paenibacillus senegalensis TaxID=1465766 RepID=UPI000287CEE6|nr:NEW3 domain-containing protein [Paenibacillus senegalensis]
MQQNMFRNWVRQGVALWFLLGALLIAAPQTSAAASLELYTPYTDLSVPPGESLSYSVEIINRGSETQRVPLALDTNGHTWETDLTAGGRNIRQISVKPGEQQTVNLTLQVPLEVDKGEYQFVLRAGDAASLPLLINVSEQGSYSTEFEAEQANMEGHADSSFKFSTTLRNRTAEEQTYSLTSAAPAGWTVRFSSGGNNVTSVTVEPNASQTVSVDITPPQTIEAGTYQIPVQAANNATSAETMLEVVITGTYDLKLSTASERLNAEVTAGSERRLDLVVTNNGTAELDEISLKAQTPMNWEVTFEPAAIPTLAPGATANVQAVIKADNKALAGDYVVGLTAQTAQKSSEAAIRVAVKSSVLWGWIGVLILLGVAAGIYGLFRKYGRR